MSEHDPKDWPEHLDAVLPKALRLPPQATHTIEVAAEAAYPFRGIRVEFKP